MTKMRHMGFCWAGVYSKLVGKKVTIEESKSLVERFKRAKLSGGLVSGLLIGLILGGTGVRTIDENIYQNRTIFPKFVDKYEVIDGDTFIIDNGLSVRLLGIDAPNRGEPNYVEAGNKLESLLFDKNNNVFWLEYDRYQLDQFGRILAWVWVNCEAPPGMTVQSNKGPKFLPADYMEKSKNESQEGLMENPEGCKEGKLVNEEMVKAGIAKLVKYGDRGEMKYEERIKMISK